MPSNTWICSKARLAFLCALVSFNTFTTSLAASSGVADVRYIPRSCHEGRGHPDMKQSGMYWIDPDGIGIGQGPIYVYCDMDNGETAISHDTEGKIGVSCVGTDCYDRKINYLNATMRHMTALSKISKSCYQSIEVNCLRMPFQIGSGGSATQVSWWLDRTGKRQYFWAGAGTSGEHTCQCGLESPNACITSNVKCNCDENVAIPLTDAGNITAKAVLPVTGLHFGNVAHEGGSYKLGKFTCKGSDGSVTNSGRTPLSCEELWRIGHSLDGNYLFYADDGGKKFRSAFCDFKGVDSTLDEEFVKEKSLGFINAN